MATEWSLGFGEDVHDLLNEFVATESCEFDTFCRIWKRKNMQYIFYGRQNDIEIVEFVSEALITLKLIFMNAANGPEKIGAFYMLYALYFKQPVKEFCKIRVTLEDWRAVRGFVEEQGPGAVAQQILLIFLKLFSADAFRFVQHEHEHGYDLFFSKRLQKDPYESRFYGAFNELAEMDADFQAMKSPTGLFTALDAIQMGYNEMKEALDDSSSSSAGATGSSSTTAGNRIPQSTLMATLHEDLEYLLAMMSTKTGGRTGDNDLDREVDEEDVGTDDIGTRRIRLRERAYKQRVRRKDLQIAGTSKRPASGKDATAPKSPGAFLKRLRRRKRKPAPLRPIKRKNRGTLTVDDALDRGSPSDFGDI